MTNDNNTTSDITYTCLLIFILIEVRKQQKHKEHNTTSRRQNSVFYNRQNKDVKQIVIIIGML